MRRLILFPLAIAFVLAICLMPPPALRVFVIVGASLLALFCLGLAAGLVMWATRSERDV